jgi:hypothetical protein
MGAAGSVSETLSADETLSPDEVVRLAGAAWGPAFASCFAGLDQFTISREQFTIVQACVTKGSVTTEQMVVALRSPDGDAGALGTTFTERVVAFAEFCEKATAGGDAAPAAKPKRKIRRQKTFVGEPDYDPDADTDDEGKEGVETVGAAAEAAADGAAAEAAAAEGAAAADGAVAEAPAAKPKRKIRRQKTFVGDPDYDPDDDKDGGGEEGAAEGAAEEANLSSSASAPAVAVIAAVAVAAAPAAAVGD